MDEETIELPKIKISSNFIVGIVLTALLLLILQHNLSFQQHGTIVIPAGGTYLGPNAGANGGIQPPPVAVIPTDTPVSTPPSSTKDGTYITGQGKFAVTRDAVWVTVRGRIYPYAFESPKTLKLVTFPNDTYDIYAIAWNNTPPDQNVLIGVDNLESRDSAKQYINVAKRSYVETWYKQFGLKGVASITEFTNSKGLKGYRAKYIDSAGRTPNDDVFFEVPNPQYVIHLASGILDASAFNHIVDSVSWSTK